MRFKLLVVMGLIAFGGLITATVVMRVRATTAESTTATEAESATDDGRSWKDLYAEAEVVAQVQVLRIAGRADMDVIAEVKPIAVFKSDGAPLR